MKKLTTNERNTLGLIIVTIVFLFVTLVRIEMNIAREQNVHQKVEKVKI